MNRLVVSFATLLIVVSTFSPVAAEAPDGMLRLFGALASPTADLSTSFDVGGGPVPATLEAQSTFGLGVFYEVRVGDRLGVDTGIYFADFDFEVRAGGGTADLGSALAIPVTLGLDVHIAGTDRFDAYVGPFLAYTTWGDLEGPFGTASTDSDFGFGGVVGIDVRGADSRWTFSGALRYLAVSAGDESVDIDVNPLFVEIGLGRRF